jgi:hypothetical protein
LYVSVGTYGIVKNAPLPSFTASYSGFIGNDSTTIVSGPTFTVSPAYTGAAGVYSIIPSNLVLDPPAYTIIYQPGTLYVNPKGAGTKKVRVYLECVDTLVNHPDGFDYLARFRYENDNATPIYVPVGPDNFLTALGSYTGNPPTVFLPGVHYFDIPFDGLKITWTLKTYNVNQKSAAASEASSTSNRCNSGSGSRVMFQQEESFEDVDVYPNPSGDFVMVRFNTGAGESASIILYDLTGREHVVQTDRNANEVRMDLSSLINGLYLIRVKTEESERIIRLVKE